jgi:hypothetical protein
VSDVEAAGLLQEGRGQWTGSFNSSRVLQPELLRTRKYWKQQLVQHFEAADYNRAHRYGSECSGLQFEDCVHSSFSTIPFSRFESQVHQAPRTPDLDQRAVVCLFLSFLFALSE